MSRSRSNPKKATIRSMMPAQVEMFASSHAIPLPETLEAAEQVLRELRLHQVELELQNEELRRAQAALELSQARYVNLFDRAPVGYITVSEKALIIEANLTVANLLGVERRELIGQSLTHFIWPEDQDIYYLHCKQLFEARSATGTSPPSEQANGPQIYEMRLKRSDDTPFWARLTVTRMQDSDGIPTCWLVLSDISEIKQTAIKLHQIQVFNQKILGATPGLVYIYDLAAQQEIFINRPFATMLGYRFDQDADVGSVFLPSYIHPVDVHLL